MAIQLLKSGEISLGKNRSFIAFHIIASLFCSPRAHEIHSLLKLEPLCPHMNYAVPEFHSFPVVSRPAAAAAASGEELHYFRNLYGGEKTKIDAILFIRCTLQVLFSQNCCNYTLGAA